MSPFQKGNFAPERKIRHLMNRTYVLEKIIQLHFNSISATYWNADSSWKAVLSPDGEVPRVQTLRSQATDAPGGMAGDEGKTRRRGTVMSRHIFFHISAFLKPTCFQLLRIEMYFSFRKLDCLDFLCYDTHCYILEHHLFCRTVAVC